MGAMGWQQRCSAVSDVVPLPDAASSKALACAQGQRPNRGLMSVAAGDAQWSGTPMSTAMPACRSIMQRVIRMCAPSAKLWAEYFRMELLHAAKLHTRRSVLSLEALAGKIAYDSYKAGFVPAGPHV